MKTTTEQHDFPQTRAARLTIAVSLLAFAIIILPLQPTKGCDVCLRAPRAPFVIDCVAALEVAIATREAAEDGNLEMNPVLDASLSPDRRGQLRLNEVSYQQLVRRWLQTQPGQRIRQSQMTVDLLFVETGATFRLDFRAGFAMEASDQEWPANARVITTKAGFYQLFDRGLDFCEGQRVVHIEPESEDTAELLKQVFLPN